WTDAPAIAVLIFEMPADQASERAEQLQIFGHDRIGVMPASPYPKAPPRIQLRRVSCIGWKREKCSFARLRVAGGGEGGANVIQAIFRYFGHEFDRSRCARFDGQRLLVLCRVAIWRGYIDRDFCGLIDGALAVDRDFPYWPFRIWKSISMTNALRDEGE